MCKYHKLYILQVHSFLSVFNQKIFVNPKIANSLYAKIQKTWAIMNLFSWGFKRFTIAQKSGKNDQSKKLDQSSPSLKKSGGPLRAWRKCICTENYQNLCFKFLEIWNLCLKKTKILTVLNGEQASLAIRFLHLNVQVQNEGNREPWMKWNEMTKSQVDAWKNKYINNDRTSFTNKL